MKNILIVDDDAEMLNSLNKLLSRNNNYTLTLVQNESYALEIAKNKKFDLIITDLQMKEISGIEILRAALGEFPGSSVIIISGYGTIESSVNAMREGAFDFLEKPFTSKKLYEVVEKALNQNFVAQEAADEEVKKTDGAFSGIISQSPEIKKIIDIIHKIAPGHMNVLISGESGTGKELFARAIHKLSKRVNNPFVPVNCGALPENLFESELFGHERGAFTGALRTKPGLLEFANNGTFFLDEIGDLNLTMQVKLLRMLEDKKIRRVGGEREIDIDVRIIAATNKDLNIAIEDNEFREDLFYRLNTIDIHILPLRERGNDILLLANHFLANLSGANKNMVYRFSAEAEKALISYHWPGNVRELQNMVSRAFYLATGNIIQRADLPILKSENDTIFVKSELDLPYKEAKESFLEQFEVEYLTHHIKLNNGNISKTAEACGIDRRSIHRLINKYSIIYNE
jgi:two-component system, NtrC family, response regulator HydG